MTIVTLMINLTGASRRRKVRSLHHRRRSPTPLQQVLNFYSGKMGEFCSHNGGCVSKGIQYYILWLWQHGEIIAEAFNCWYLRFVIFPPHQVVSPHLPVESECAFDAANARRLSLGPGTSCFTLRFCFALTFVCHFHFNHIKYCSQFHWGLGSYI